STIVAARLIPRICLVRLTDWSVVIRRRLCAVKMSVVASIANGTDGFASDDPKTASKAVGAIAARGTPVGRTVRLMSLVATASLAETAVGPSLVKLDDKAGYSAPATGIPRMDRKLTLETRM